MAKALGAEPEPDINQQELKGTVRELLAEEGSSLVIFDNVDGEPPFPLQELLLHGASSKCVCIGGGLKDCDRAVALEAPTEQEFIDIAWERLGGAKSLSGTAVEFIRDIGRLCDCSALCGRAVGWQCSPGHVEEDLRSFRDALAEVGAAPLEQRIEAAIRKCWSVLDATSRRRVRFIAALGLSQVSLIMLPEELRQGAPGSWRLLKRSGVAPRGKDKEVEVIRIHRLIASWADKNMEPQSVVDVATALLHWVRDSQLADELKAFSPLLRAFTNAFQVVARHGFPQGMPTEDIGLLRRAYLDGCGHLALERPALERLIHIGMDGVFVSSLPPVVLGQLLDGVPERIAEGSEYLKALRREVAATLASWVERNPPGDTYLDESQADLVDAYRHHAKELFRVKNETEAVALMQRIDGICAQAVERSPRRPMWHVLQTKGRLQLARRAAGPYARWQLELLELLERRQDPLPDYLRLAGLRLVVKEFPKITLDTIPAGQREAMIREGLELCRRRRSHVIQEEFLLAAVNAIEVASLRSLYPEVIEAAEQVLTHSPTKGFVPRPPIGYALFRAAAADTSADALGRIMQGLQLIVPGQQAPDAFQTIRAAGILRDAGRPDLAEPVLRAVYGKEQQTKGRPTFWSTLELAKTLRWRGNCEEAARVLEAFRGDQKFGLGASDELAKSLATTKKMDEAKKLLEENARGYEADNFVAFAAQCRHWVPASLVGSVNPGDCSAMSHAAECAGKRQVQK